MKSKYPKVMHKVCGKRLIDYSLEVASGAGSSRIIVVVGHGREMVESAIGDRAEIVYQSEQLGTGHAVLQAKEALSGYRGTVLVMAGDMPLLTVSDLTNLLGTHIQEGASATILVGTPEDPTGYGRIVRDQDGRVTGIVEEADLLPSQKDIREINTSVYCFESVPLFSALSRLDSKNAQGEYYLTDVIGILLRDGHKVATVTTGDPCAAMGINSRRQLAEIEALMRERIRQELMESGVTLIDPSTVFVDRDVKIGRDTVIYPMTFIEGSSVIGEDVVLGPNVQIVDCEIKNGARVQQAVVLESIIGLGATVGPFAYIRPGTVLSEGAKVGTFVEVKKSHVGKGSKVPHQSYIGDAIIGEGVNVGAGTITCNYDGVRKHQSVIEDGAFIGSNTNLVAPVKVGKGAYVAAGSTITQDVPEGALGIARGHQRNIEGWVARRSKK